MSEQLSAAICDTLMHSDVWIGDDGQPLDYLPEREARIGGLVGELASAVSAHVAAQLADVRALADGAELAAEMSFSRMIDGRPFPAMVAVSALRAVLDAPEGTGHEEGQA